MAGNYTCDPTRAALQGYVLNTLADRERRAVEAHLHACPACREALEAEQVRLAVLDTLPREDAPAGLAERTLAGIAAAESDQARGLPRWALVAGSTAAIVVVATLILPMFSRARESARRGSTQGTMKQWGLVFKMYANESKGERWPQLASANGAWTPDLSPLHDTHISDPQIMVSEEHPDRKKLIRQLQEAWSEPVPDFEKTERLMGESFGYLGYSIQDEVDFQAVRRAKERHELPPDGAPVNDVADGVRVQPLREGIERFLITDINNPAGSAEAQSSVPVLIEIATWKYKKTVDAYKGASVLYMDGHVAFVPYGTFPVVPSVLDALSGTTTAQ